MLSVFFLLITLSALCLFYFGTGKDKLLLIISLLWLILVGTVAASGYFENTTARPPRFLFVLLGSFAFVLFFYWKLKSNPLNMNLLLVVHTLRLPVELILYRLFLAKQIPVLMTFRGWNFDIVMGISAIALFLYYVFTKRNVSSIFLIAWNLLGLIFLTSIVVIAILSSPLPIQQWAFDQPNTALLKLPFTFLPALVVPVVYLSHFLVLRKLLTSK